MAPSAAFDQAAAAVLNQYKKDTPSDIKLQVRIPRVSRILHTYDLLTESM